MIKLNKNVLAFAAGHTEIFEAFADLFAHYQSLNGKKGKTYVEFDASGKAISYEQKETQMNAMLKKEIIRRSGVSYAAEQPVETWFSHPLVQHETFAIISALVDVILPETIIESIGAYSDIRQGGWSDSFSFEIKPRDLFVVSKAGRNQRTAEVQKQFNGLVTLIPEMRELTVGTSFLRLLNGSDSLAEFAMKAARSMETAMTVDAYNAFATAMAALPTSPAATALQVTGYTQSALVGLAQKVSAYNGGNKPVILGTQLALQNVLPLDANYRYDLQSEYVKMGYVPTAFGYDMLMLPQVAAWQTPFSLVLDDTKLWLVSPSVNKIVKVAIEGNTLSNVTAPFQMANMLQTSTLYKSWVVGVATNSKM